MLLSFLRCAGSGAGDRYVPTLIGFEQQGPEEGKTASLVVAFEAGLRSGYRFNGKSPECRWLIQGEADVLLYPAIADMKLLDLWDLTCTIEQAVLELVPVDTVICLVVTAST